MFIFFVRDSKVFFFANLREKFPIIESRVMRDHLFSTYAKFSKKLTF